MRPEPRQHPLALMIVNKWSAAALQAEQPGGILAEDRHFVLLGEWRTQHMIDRVLLPE